MTRGGGRVEGQELMMLLQEGDEAAFEKIVTLYTNSVIGTIYRFTGDASRAEDLAQEVFMRIYRSRKTYQPRARFKTWLFKILNNLVINEVHARKRRRAFSLDSIPRGLDSPIAVEDENVLSPVEELERAELMGKVREAVLGLPEKQRLAIVMNKYESLSYGQIAEAMGLSVEAVKSMLFRAREKMRARLIRYLKVEASDEV